MTWEAVEAYDKALGLSPKNPSAILSQQGLLLIDLLNVREKVNDRLWRVFERLVELDTQGEYVRTVVDNFFSLENLEQGLDILERAVEKTPDRVDLHINLAAAYISGGDGEYAVTELDEARRLTDDDQVYADIDQLMLTANDPDFEATMADIGDKVSAGSMLEEDEVDYLEQIVESAPQYGDAYLLLAKAYQLWNDDGAAMETLLDAEKHLPKDPDILEALGRLLWAAGERVSAFGYIKRGVEDNPLHIPLLSLMGQYLFEDDQRDAAKVYLARAEALSPNHAALNAARREIAAILQEED
jgi:tetratricopeptide (TPR) repeat protein